MDLDFHSFSFRNLVKARMVRSKENVQWGSSLVAILLWLVLLLDLVVIFLPWFQHKLWGWNGWHWTNITNDSIRHMWNFLWLESRQVDFEVDVLDLDFLVEVNSIEQPIKRNSVGPGNMSHCGTLFFNDHLNERVVVLKNIQQSFLTRKLDVWGNGIEIIQRVDLLLRFLIFVNDNGSLVSFRSLNRISKNRNNQIPQFENRKPVLFQSASEKWVRILLNCAKLNFVSYTSNSMELTNGLRQYTMFHLELDFESFSSPAKSESRNSHSLHFVGNYQQSKTVFLHMCDGV